MPDEDEECKFENQQQRDEVRVRKPRPEIQIYRPGMLRKGTDLTLGVPPPTSKPPTELVRERPNKLPEHGRFSGRKLDNTRRQSNDSESQNSYRGDSGSTTPDAASVSSSHAFRSKTYVRGGGGGGNRRHDNSDSRHHNEDAYSNYSSRNGSQMSSRQGSRDDIREVRYNRSQKPYDSTQSLYDSRKPGGYLDYRSPRKNDFRRDFQEFSSPGSRFQRAPPKGNERASMRAEAGHRRQTGRRRNDSINSTQSERPPAPEHVADARLETQSQASDDQSLTYRQICESFESLGSINWSEEMEAEYNEKVRREEEEKAKELQQKLEACASELEEQESGGDSKLSNVRGILRVNVRDRAKSPKQAWRGRGGKMHNRGGRMRRDSDRSSSVGESIAEEDESEDDLASGEKTPTKELEREEKKWSSRGGRQHKKTYGTSNRMHENGRNGRYHENHDPNGYSDSRGYSSKYKGDHDFDRGDAPPSRFKSRLTFPNRDHNEENFDNRGRRPVSQRIYHPRQQEDIRGPPAVLKSNRTAASSAAAEPKQKDTTAQHEDSDEMPLHDRQISDFPIYAQISKDQGPRMQKVVLTFS